jgi:alkylation response protein AidB-like acyl-CoA dehydrogenase
VTVDLTPSVEQELVAESARRLVEGVRVTTDRLDFDPDLWRTMASLGWAGLALGEEHGGAGRGAAELAVVCEALGTGPVPSPLVTTTTAALAIAWAGNDEQRARWLPALASGAAVATLALLEAGASDEWDEPRLGGGPTVRGTKLMVPWAGGADVLVVTTADGLVLVETSGDGVRVDRHDDIGADPLSAVELADAPAVPLGAGGREEQRAVIERTLDWAAVLQLASVVGSAARVLDMTVQHARDRHQFGQPIGAFQAVAHRCVDVRTDLDACRYLAYRAAWALDRGGDAALEVASAKAYAGDAMRRIFAHAHQVHGAVGFSTEHDLHLFTRRAKAFELSFGTTGRHLDRVATAMGLG